MICTLCFLKNVELQWIPAVAYLVAGYSTVPGCLTLAWYTDESLVRPFAIWPWLTGGIMYGIGAVIFALKVPERCVPKKFDIWCHSHSLFHWFILFAAMLHFWASLRAFHERQLFPCPEAAFVPTEPSHFEQLLASGNDQ